MSDDTPIYKVLEELPETSLTTRVLGALDYLVPGEWTNVVNFEQMIRNVTGEDDSALIQTVGERALALYLDPSENYQRAVWVFRKLDGIDQAAGMAAMANKIGSSFNFLSFLETVTPKPDTAQALDAGIKFAGELTTFCLVNGIPGDSIADFAKSLANYGKEDAMRLAAWLAIDCVIPLGPDFFNKISDSILQISEEHLANNPLFQKVQSFLPGNGINAHRELIAENLHASREVMEGFVANKDMTQDGLFNRVRQYVEVADDRLDYVAAALDLTTNYFEHTGIQTVARRLISRAYGEI